ncbi:MAG: CPBP family intramembrane metalloprotease [bacterium]|nr:MAG: CPBP family intramembrane metalloprotease [bacterium]
MTDKIKYIIAICIGILPINIFMIWYRLTHTEGFTTFEMLVYPLLFGGGNILLILALNKYLLNKNLRDFNLGKGKWYQDIMVGLILTTLYFLLMFLERSIFLTLLPPQEPPSQEVIKLMIDLARKPLLLALWLGPVVWIGVALFEEISRTFFFNCLWQLSPQKSWQIMSIFLVSLVVGFTHLYQGPFGIISVSIQGIVIGFYYYKAKRIAPLIISHALYDSIQIITFVVQVY